MSNWTAIVLAGQRPGFDPLAAACGQTYKALVEICGQSMLSRVCNMLLQSSGIERVVILAQEPAALMVGDAAHFVDDPRVALISGETGIAASIAAIAGTKAAPWPVLVTTADHALLSTDMIEEFLSQTGDADLAVGVGERAVVERAYPDTKRTWLKFSDGHYSGANLFALRSANVMSALALWSGIEQDRKKGLKVLSQFGPYLLLRALTRTIAFPDAMARAGNRIGLAAKPVTLSQPEAVIDVDKIEDLHLVERILTDAC